MFWIPAAIGAAASLAGSALSSRDARAANLAQQEMTDKNIAYQKEFARHGVAWRVEDAREAGISPLAALGWQGPQFSPVYQPSQDTESWSRAGQDIARIGQNLSMELLREDLRTKKLNNEMLESQLVGGDRANVQVVPAQITAENKARPGLEAGIGPGQARSRLESGRVITHLSPRTQEAIEDDPYAYSQMFVDRLIGHKDVLKYFLSPSSKGAQEHRGTLRSIRPPSTKEGYEYRISPYTNSWVLKKIGKLGSRLYAIDGPLRSKERAGGRAYGSREWNNKFKYRLKPSH